MKVTEKDLTGDIKNFPIEIVQAMCENQVSQGNPFNPGIFAECKWAAYDLGGFDWHKTSEKNPYWYNIIDEEHFHLFEIKPTSNYYLVYYLTGNEYYSESNDIFITDNLDYANKYVDKFNSILNKWKNIYSDYTYLDHGVTTIKPELKGKYKRWLSLNNVLQCKIKSVNFRK